MLKAIATLNNRRTLFLGLQRENTKRLHDDKPIVIDLQALLAGDDPIQDIVIYAAETHRGLHDQLTSLGLPMPPFVEPTPEHTVFHRRGR